MKPKAIQVSDLEDFKKTYLNYQKLILKVAYDTLQDYYMAQDVCQEAFLRLGFYFDFMPESKRLPWLITVAGNYAKDMLKKGGQYHETVGLPPGNEADGQPDYFVEKHLTELILKGELVSELRRLREKNVLWYEVLMLIEYLEIPRARVAEEYQVSVRALEGYLRRAKRWLRENCGKEWEF